MKCVTKVWLIAAGVLIIAGAALFSAVMTYGNWDFKKLGTVEYETVSYDITEDFENISIECEGCGVILKPSEDGGCRVVCREAEGEKHSVSVEDRTLTVRQTEKRKWHEYIAINLTTPEIILYLPKTEYGTITASLTTGDIAIPKGFTLESAELSTTTGDIRLFSSDCASLKLKTTTGDINLSDISANSAALSVTTGLVNAESIHCDGEFALEVSTGRAVLTDITCKRLTSSGTTGDIYLKNVPVDGALVIKRSTGNIKLDGCDAAEIKLKTATGNITGRLLTDKLFIAESRTGNVTVPKTETGGKCEIETNTGNINISVTEN